MEEKSVDACDQDGRDTYGEHFDGLWAFVVSHVRSFLLFGCLVHPENTERFLGVCAITVALRLICGS